MQPSRKKTKLWELFTILIIGACTFTPGVSFAQEGDGGPEPTPEPAEEPASEENAEEAAVPDVDQTEEPKPEPAAVLPIEPHPYLRPNRLEEGNWSPPLNLSETGSASSPTAVIDQNRTMHLFWVDAFDGQMYMQKSGSLSLPINVATPFDPHTPELLIDELNRVNAFWLDGNDQLLFARADADKLNEFGSWSEPEILADDAVAFAAEFDAADQLHLVYHAAENRDARIAYRTRPIDPAGWSQPATIYQSPYLRLADRDSGHVSLAVTDSQIVAAWNNPGRDWVMVSRSEAGLMWSEASIIDQRTLDDDARTNPPADPLLFAHGDSVNISWHAGHGDFVCARYFAQSNDGGETFSKAAQVIGDLFQCPSHGDVIPLPETDGDFMLLTRTDELTYLSIWQNSEWQARKIQPKLVQFRDEMTGREVQLDCYQPLITDRLVTVVGCDRSIGQDIWMTEYRLDDLVTSVTQERTSEPEPEADSDDAPAAEDAARIDISLPDVPEPSNLSTFGGQSGLVSIGLMLLGVLVVGLGIFTLFRRK